MKIISSTLRRAVNNHFRAISWADAIILFEERHARGDWSRRGGIDDINSRRARSLVLVFNAIALRIVPGSGTTRGGRRKSKCPGLNDRSYCVSLGSVLTEMMRVPNMTKRGSS